MTCTVLGAGLALALVACGLDTTARNTDNGIVVPALHSGATNQPVTYTPVCTTAPLPVCVHPAYAGGGEPAVLSGIINAVAAPVIGVPGMPVRAEQAPRRNGPAGAGPGVSGSPPVLAFGSFIIHGGRLQPPAFAEAFRSLIALALFTPPAGAGRDATPVQRALALYLVQHAGGTPDPLLLQPGDPLVASAARRFSTLPAADQSAWLTANLAAIRAGDLTIGDIP